MLLGLGLSFTDVVCCVACVSSELASSDLHGIPSLPPRLPPSMCRSFACGLRMANPSQLRICNPPPPLAIAPPPADRHFTVLPVNIYYGGLCCPSVTHVLTLLSHYFKSITCVCSMIFSLQRWCMGVVLLFSVVGPSPNGQQFCHIRYICPGGVTQVDHENAQLSRLATVVVTAPKSPESPDISMASEPQMQAQPTHVVWY